MTAPPRRVWCGTLGCDKNLVDSEALLGRFAARGVEPTNDPDAADIWVLNTCGFIEAARRDSREALRDLARRKGDGRRLVVTGCWAQETGGRLAADFPEIDLVAGVGNFERVVEACLGAAARAPGQEAPLLASAPAAACYEGLARRPLLTPPHVAFVKISEGCDRGCSFCRIPLIRGPQRSRPPAEIAAEVADLAARGVREIQIVAQNSSDYGRDLGVDLLALVTCLDRIEALRWIRLLYLYPGCLDLDQTRRLLDLPRVVPYLDLPVQHASPRLLRAMRRPADSQGLRRYFAALRAERPDLALRTTLLLGFPGEEEEDIERLADFLAEVEFDHVGAHRYSPEIGTPAADLGAPVPVEEAADREARLLDLQAEIAGRRQRRRLGQVHEMVVDAVVARREAAPILESLRGGDRPAGRNRDEATLVLARGGRIALARSRHQAYDLDGAVALPAEGLAPGAWLWARVIAVTPHDMLAAPVAAPDRGKGG